MQKNWYIIYTKAKCEKKVASVFTKKKIENFIPWNTLQISSGRKQRTTREPLFSSYVFANIIEEEINKIKKIDGVRNIVFWKFKPAIIKEEEIKMIKEFTSLYQDIKVEKTRVNEIERAGRIDNARYLLEGNILTVKNTIVKINLPSIGFNLVANIEIETPLHSEVSFGKKDLLLQ